MTKTLYSRLIEAGCEIDNHYSDLYIRATTKAREIVRQFRLDNPGRNFCDSFFVSPIDGALWLEFPLLFDPYWEARRT